MGVINNRSRIRHAATVGLHVVVITFCGVINTAQGSDIEQLIDGFETPQIDRDRWWLGQAVKGRFWIDSRLSRSGHRSLALQMTGDLRGCGVNCQRNEIRTAPANRTEFGQELWYSFSFRIKGDFPKHGNERWVSGQWKQQSGGSPFLSQRFDRGIFHIAVHDGHCRILIASAAGALEPLGTTIDVSKIQKFAYKTDKLPFRCKTELVVEPAKNAVLPDPYANWVDMVYRVRGHRNSQGLIEVWANGRFIVRVRGPIGYDGATGPNQYFKFGIYRDAMPGTATVYFDDFRRSANPPNNHPAARAR